MIIIGGDILSYLGIGHKRIDIENWKHDKLHSNEIEDVPSKKEKWKRNLKKGKKVHFKYIL